MNPVCHRYNQSWNKGNEHLMSTQRYPHEANMTPLPPCFHALRVLNYGAFSRVYPQCPLPFPSWASTFPWVNPRDNFP